MASNRPAGFVYMLKCADDSYYIGSHRGSDVYKRVAEHNLGVHPQSYTFRRRPVELMWNESFDRYDDMIACERQLKGWSRAKKEALIAGDGYSLKAFSARGFRPAQAAHPSRRRFAPPQDEA